MDRRKFLSMLAVGAPAAVIGVKLGLAAPHPFTNNGASSGICTACGGIITEHESVAIGPPNETVRVVLPPKGWEVGPDGLLRTRSGGQSLFCSYDESGALAPGWIRYRLRDNGRIETEHVTIGDLVTA
jgi:hypothetical protein